MTAEQELRDLIEERVRAVRAKDRGTLAGHPAQDVVTFDALSRRRDKASYSDPAVMPMRGRRRRGWRCPRC